MREIVFLVTVDQPGRIEATAPDRRLMVAASTLEELHHEVRDALIRQVGPSHATYRIRIRRAGQNLVSARGAQLAHCHLFPSARSLPNGKTACEAIGTAGGAHPTHQRLNILA